MISIIVAAAKNGVIGKTNALPWYLPAEMAYFRDKTTGHPIIMGRKTHESIGRSLPDRTNIVITHDRNYKAANKSIVVGSLEEALKNAEKAPGSDEIFIIGGEAIYEQALPKADRLYLTKVEAEIDGDKFFMFKPAEWKQISSQKHIADDKNQYPFEFTVLERKPA